jgi:ketosteroid isomerase-like protein
MKTFLNVIRIIVMFIMTIPLSAQSTDGLDTTKLMKEFRNQTENWMNAYNSRDAQNLLSLYSEDAQYISSHVAGLVAIGREKLIANFQNGMNMGGHIDGVEILSMNVSCDLATLLCRYQATNSGVTVTGRNLLILKKIDDQWLIIIHMTVV